MQDVIKLPIPIFGGGEQDYQPLKDYVLVEPLDRTETKGGIALPNGAKLAEPDLGRVVAVGPGKTTEYGAFVPIDGYGAGDLIWVNQHTPGIPKQVGSKVFVIIRDRDVIGRYEPPQAKAAAELATAA